MLDTGRQQRLEQTFVDAFGSLEGTHLVRAPGRVNLIGEHTDYNGLPVFPVALQRDIAVLYRARTDNKVQLVDVTPAFGARSFELSETIEPSLTGNWGNYAKAAAQALVGRLGPIPGLDGAICGQVPRDAGLSSSSALVVACALALIHSNSIRLDSLELAELLAKGEHYVGTRGGGMDQAACLGGQVGKALKIDFFPLRWEPIQVPSGWRFVVAHSLEVAKKTGSALGKYNQRPQECRTALQHVREKQSSQITFSDLAVNSDIDALLERMEPLMPRGLFPRFRHVVTEGGRVEAARSAMLSEDEVCFGQLMNESHRSLREDFEISTAALDRLVDCCREGGALGARMTGAGFGGCAVALAHASEVEALTEYLEQHFYAARPPLPGVPDYLFIADPSAGAELVF